MNYINLTQDRYRLLSLVHFFSEQSMNIITLKSSTNNARSAKGCFGSKAGTERERCAVIPRPVRHGWLIGRWRVRAPSRSHDHALFRTFVHDSNTVATDTDCMSEPYFGIRSFHLTLQGLVRFRIRNLFDLKKIMLLYICFQMK
jgi:hypothetical protein